MASPTPPPTSAISAISTKPATSARLAALPVTFTVSPGASRRYQCATDPRAHPRARPRAHHTRPIHALTTRPTTIRPSPQTHISGNTGKKFGKLPNIASPPSPPNSNGFFNHRQHSGNVPATFRQHSGNVPAKIGNIDALHHRRPPRRTSPLPHTGEERPRERRQERGARPSGAERTLERSEWPQTGEGASLPPPVALQQRSGKKSATIPATTSHHSRQHTPHQAHLPDVPTL